MTRQKLPLRSSNRVVLPCEDAGIIEGEREPVSGIGEGREPEEGEINDRNALRRVCIVVRFANDACKRQTEDALAVLQELARERARLSNFRLTPCAARRLFVCVSSQSLPRS